MRHQLTTTHDGQAAEVGPPQHVPPAGGRAHPGQGLLHGPHTEQDLHRQHARHHKGITLVFVLFWKSISGLKFPCFLFYACLLPEWIWEPVEFRAIPILLRKLPKIC